MGAGKRRPLAICLLAFCHARGHMRDACAPRKGRASEVVVTSTRPLGPLVLPNSEMPGPSVRPFAGRLSSRIFRKDCQIMRVNGTVKFFNVAKGFGFITPESGGKDVFVHATALEAAGIRSLNEGDKVSFVIEDDRRGRGKQAAQLEKA